ncbi:MAG: hypothetical protein M0Q93_04380 [Terrimicrobiaceae bacterium]|nr:hypothetical protein [Terrimicrobiaceae bacterium]
MTAAEHFFGSGVEAKAVTTAGTKWSGWRGLCRGWGCGAFAATWLHCEGGAGAFVNKRRSNLIRSM